MLPEREWSRAFLLQAKSDWAMYLHLCAQTDVPRCHILHYLQMATEKLAKTYLYDPAQGRKVHRAFALYFQMLRKEGHLKSRVQATMRRMDDKQYAAFLRDLRGLAESTEKLAPAEAGDGPNPEYPWEMRSPSGDMFVESPVNYLFPIFDITKMGKMDALVEKCIKVAEDEYGN